MALVDSTIVVDPSNVVVSTGAAQAISVAGAAGIRGPQGEKGDAVASRPHSAGANISGHRAIRLAAGLAYHCDGATQAQAGRCIGISRGAALEGDTLEVQTLGLLTEPSWSWNEGAVFIGFDGVLTQSLVGLAYVQQIGLAVSPTQIDINLLSPIVTSEA